MTDTPPEPVPCCGVLPGEHLPGAGRPQVLACQLCKRSGQHWRGETEESATDQG